MLHPAWGTNPVPQAGKFRFWRPERLKKHMASGLLHLSCEHQPYIFTDVVESRKEWRRTRCVGPQEVYKSLVSPKYTGPRCDRRWRVRLTGSFSHLFLLSNEFIHRWRPDNYWDCDIFTFFFRLTATVLSSIACCFPCTSTILKLANWSCQNGRRKVHVGPSGTEA